MGINSLPREGDRRSEKLDSEVRGWGELVSVLVMQSRAQLHPTVGCCVRREDEAGNEPTCNGHQEVPQLRKL